MYLKRKIDVFLENWKVQNGRKPLIIRGARQIGKTEAIRHFAARHYDNIVEINFVDGNLGFANNIYTVPHFCAFLIKDWLSRK